MAIPDYQQFMLPVLNYLADDKIYQLKDITDFTADNVFELSQTEKEEMLASRRQTVVANRVGWAVTYLKKAGLIDNASRGNYQITSLGKELIEAPPTVLDTNYLKKYPSFLEFYNTSNKKNVSITNDSRQELTPEDMLEYVSEQLKAFLEDELLRKIKTGSPAFFERLVVDLLVKMGYGGSRAEFGQAIGRSGDGGIDGVIKEDKLGLDIIYIQAKRWEGTVGRPEIQKFAVALQGQRANKGVFITTSDFSKDAREYVCLINNKIVLINGKLLAELMIDQNVGTVVTHTYEVKIIDLDYFIEE